jgi:BA14K-like protein
MISKLALTALLALAVCGPVREAAAQDTLGGAIFGGAAGAIVGGALGGGRGAAAGAIIGATTGAAIASQGQARPGGYYYYQNGCYIQQPDGSWVGVAPRYCATAQYAPPQQYAPQVDYGGGPGCMRARSYDPGSGTFVGRDGYRRPCP